MKINNLQSFFEGKNRIALAFSGGVDSSFLLWFCKKSNIDVIPYFVKTAFQSERQLDDAKEFCKDLGIDIKVISYDIFSNPDINVHADDRCYHCKKMMFQSIKNASLKDGCEIVIDGTNMSDNPNRRPGMKALDEENISSPLRLAGLKRDDIISLSRDAGLPTWNRPASSCLAVESSFFDLGFAKPDHKRKKRCGINESILALGKTKSQIEQISLALYNNGSDPIIITKLKEEIACSLDFNIPFTYFKEAEIGLVGESVDSEGGVSAGSAKSAGSTGDDLIKRDKFSENSKNESGAVDKGTSNAECALSEKSENAAADSYILVATAGTGDIKVAEEAAVCLEILGNKVLRRYDIGVAGLDRLLSHRNDIENANVIIVAAGMDAALASVIAGLTSCPIIAVPTSIGYGASFDGIAALLSMLNSCAPTVSVVNIDNGFGAACIANAINKKTKGAE